MPKSWPLARLTIPLSAASKHLEGLLEGCCNEIFVRNTNPDLQLHYVRKFAKDLAVVLAFHLAETISALFRHVLDHPSKVLYDPETEPLFLPIFWFYPIYREMLNSASRHRPSKSMELRRAVLPFIVESHVSIFHPRCNWTVRLLALLVEASTTPDEDSFVP